jgi:hypothetical protein
MPKAVIMKDKGTSTREENKSEKDGKKKGSERRERKSRQKERRRNMQRKRKKVKYRKRNKVKETTIETHGKECKI